MKRKLLIRIILTALLCLLLSAGLSLTAFASNGDIDSYNDEFSFDDITEGIDSETASVLKSLGIDELSFESIYSVTPVKVFDVLFSVFSGALTVPFAALALAFGAMLLMSVLSQMHQSTVTVSAVGSAAVAAVLSVPLVTLLTDTFSVIAALGDFTVIFAGVFCAVVSSSGNVALAFSYNSLTVGFCTLVSKLCEGVSRPAANGMCALAFLSVFDSFGVSARLCELMKKSYVIVLGLLGTVFSGLLTIKGVLGTGVDTLGARGIKYAVGRSVPIIGGAVSESLSALAASLSLIKSTVGIFGIITVIVMALPIIARLLAWGLALSLAGIFAGALGLNSLTAMLSVLKDTLTVLAATVVFTTLLLVVSVGVVLSLKGGM